MGLVVLTVQWWCGSGGGGGLEKGSGGRDVFCGVEDWCGGR